MVRVEPILFFLGTLMACSVETPCPPGERLAENQRDGATIRYCVSLSDGKATGAFSCRHRDGRAVTGTYDHNRKVGEWRYYHRGGELVRIERWQRGERVATQAAVDDARDPISCGEHVIVEAPPDFPDLDLGWQVDDGVSRRYFPDSDVVWMAGAYSDGLKDGVWEYRKRSGELYISGRYHRGLAHGRWTRHRANGRVDVARYHAGRHLGGPDLAAAAPSVRGLVSEDPGELTRHQVRKALEEALH